MKRSGLPDDSSRMKRFNEQCSPLFMRERNRPCKGEHGARNAETHLELSAARLNPRGLCAAQLIIGRLSLWPAKSSRSQEVERAMTVITTIIASSPMSASEVNSILHSFSVS